MAVRRFIYRHVIEHDIIVESAGRLFANGSLNPIDRVLYLPPDNAESRTHARVRLSIRATCAEKLA